jgi:hypothetical protein
MSKGAVNCQLSDFAVRSIVSAVAVGGSPPPASKIFPGRYAAEEPYGRLTWLVAIAVREPFPRRPYLTVVVRGDRSKMSPSVSKYRTGYSA